jgi:uncharacterized protein YbjT (DUF2867 family)
MARIVIAGGHGQVALLLSRRLADRGDVVVGLVRDAAQSDDLAAHGASAVVVDLETVDAAGLAAELEGADAVVFAAGAGPGSGAERKWSVDRDGAITLLRAAELAGVDRYVMLSSMGTDDPPEDDEAFSVYLRAKAAADEAVMASDLRWTVVRPGRLTDDEAANRVTAARHVERGEVPRADVAAVLDAVLHDDHADGRLFEVVRGQEPVDEAVATLGRQTLADD